MPIARNESYRLRELGKIELTFLLFYGESGCFQIVHHFTQTHMTIDFYGNGAGTITSGPDAKPFEALNAITDSDSRIRSTCERVKTLLENVGTDKKASAVLFNTAMQEVLKAIHASWLELDNENNDGKRRHLLLLSEAVHAALRAASKDRKKLLAVVQAADSFMEFTRRGEMRFSK